MLFTVYAQARVEADSPGGAEEIATYEEVEWKVKRRRRVGTLTCRTVGGGAVAWMATAPWADGGLGLIGEHLGRALAPVGLAIGLLTG